MGLREEKQQKRLRYYVCHPRLTVSEVGADTVDAPRRVLEHVALGDEEDTEVLCLRLKDVQAVVEDRRLLVGPHKPSQIHSFLHGDWEECGLAEEAVQRRCQRQLDYVIRSLQSFKEHLSPDGMEFIFEPQTIIVEVPDCPSCSVTLEPFPTWPEGENISLNVPILPIFKLAEIRFIASGESFKLLLEIQRSLQAALWNLLDLTDERTTSDVNCLSVSIIAVRMAFSSVERCILELHGSLFLWNQLLDSECGLLWYALCTISQGNRAITRGRCHIDGERWNALAHQQEYMHLIQCMDSVLSTFNVEYTAVTEFLSKVDFFEAMQGIAEHLSTVMLDQSDPEYYRCFRNEIQDAGKACLESCFSLLHSFPLKIDIPFLSWDDFFESIRATHAESTHLNGRPQEILDILELFYEHRARNRVLFPGDLAQKCREKRESESLAFSSFEEWLAYPLSAEESIQSSWGKECCFGILGKMQARESHPVEFAQAVAFEQSVSTSEESFSLPVGVTRSGSSGSFDSVDSSNPVFSPLPEGITVVDESVGGRRKSVSRKSRESRSEGIGAGGPAVMRGDSPVPVAPKPPIILPPPSGPEDMEELSLQAVSLFPPEFDEDFTEVMRQCLIRAGIDEDVVAKVWTNIRGTEELCSLFSLQTFSSMGIDVRRVKRALELFMEADPPSAMPSISHEGTTSGVLVKRGHFFKNWKHRYCILDGNQFSYYSSLQHLMLGKGPRKQMLVTPETEVLFMGRDEFRSWTGDGVLFAVTFYRLNGTPKEYYFVAANQQEREQWCEAILKARDRARLQEEEAQITSKELVQFAGQNKRLEEWRKRYNIPPTVEPNALPWSFIKPRISVYDPFFMEKR